MPQSLQGRGDTGLLHSQRKFPTDASCIFKAIFLAEPWLQPILSPSLQLLPGPMPVPHAMGLFMHPNIVQKQREKSPSSLSQDLSQQRGFGAAPLPSKPAQPTRADCRRPLMRLHWYRETLGLKGTAAGQPPSNSFPACPHACPVPAGLPSRAAINHPPAAMSGLLISVLRPLIKALHCSLPA